MQDAERFAVFQENQPVIENHRQWAFLEYMESKIAEKEAHDGGKAVVKLVCERFHL